MTVPTLKSFFDKLAEHRGRFRVRRDGTIRCERGKCPIIAVLGKSSKFNGEAELLAESTGLLSYGDACLVTNAADFTVRSVGTRLCRARMLDVLGLAEKKTR